MTKHKLVIDIDAELFAELSAISAKVGFDNVESLIKNYIREVILAGRVEQATSQIRNTVVRGSNDLDNLAVHKQSPKPAK